MKKDIELDAQLKANSNDFNAFTHIVITHGMTTDDVQRRAEWFIKQSRQYVHAVEMRAKKIEQEKIMDQLK